MNEETTSLERFAFGRNIQRLRKERGMSRAQLGDRAGLSAETIEEIEAGEATLDSGVSSPRQMSTVAMSLTQADSEHSPAFCM